MKPALDEWYKEIAIRFELSKNLYRREFALINKSDNNRTIRMLKCHNVNHLDYILNSVVHMFDGNDLLNLYYSLAKYREGIPNQDLSKGLHNPTRDNSEWNNRHFEEMTGYDFLIDIDCDTHEEIEYGHESLMYIMKLLNANAVKYEVRFSGCGFHIVIPYEFMPQLPLDPKADGNIYRLCSRIARYLYADYSELIDYKIYDSRRLCKLPYSMSAYPDNSKSYMCFPFHSTEQVKMFKLDYLDIRHHTSYTSAPLFRSRGLHLFNAEKQNDLGFFKELEVVI